MNTQPYFTQVQTSNGMIEVSWFAVPFYWNSDLSKGYILTDISGFNNPDFGKLFHLTEVDQNRYEYIENIAQPSSNLDEDTRAILDAVKAETPELLRH